MLPLLSAVRHLSPHDQRAFLLALALTIGMVAGGTLALWGIGGGLWLYGLAVLQQRRWLWPHPAALLVAGSFIGLMLLAQCTAIAPAPARAWPMLGRLLTIIIPLSLLFYVPDPPPTAASGRFAARVFGQLPWLMLALMGLLLAEFYSGGHIVLPLLRSKDGLLVYYNRGLSYAAVLLWPLLGWLLYMRRGRLALALALGLLVTAWCSTSRGAPLALVVGAAFFGLGRLQSAGALRIAGLLLLGFVALGSLWLVPLVFDQQPDWLRHLPPSWQHRAEIWDYLLAWWQTRPWQPLGLDAAALAPLTTQHQPLYVYALTPAAHPHHVFLQLLLELGILGWGWAVGVAGWALWRLSALAPSQRAVGAAVWGALLTLACGAFSLWSDSLWATAALGWLLVLEMRWWRTDA
jgi:hypothetical protein